VWLTGLLGAGILSVQRLLAPAPVSVRLSGLPADDPRGREAGEVRGTTIDKRGASSCSDAIGMGRSSSRDAISTTDSRIS
jgi:hypothetical protein